MFEVGYSEILVIAIVLIVVVGPKDLPKMLRAFGKTMTKFRQMSGDFQRQFNDALKEAELDDVRKTIADVRKLDPRQQVRDVFNPLRDAGNALKADLNRTAQTSVAPAAVAPVISMEAKPAVPAKPTATKAATPASSSKNVQVKSASPKTVAKSSTKSPVPMAPVTKAASTAAVAKAKPVTTKPKQTKGKTDK